MIKSFYQFESMNFDLSRDLIFDVYQDLMDLFDFKFEVDYKIFNDKIIGICIYSSELEEGFNTHAKYDDEFNNIGDKFSEIFSESNKDTGWVSTIRLTSRKIIKTDLDRIIIECSDRMNNYLEFRKPLIECEIHSEWNYETGYPKEDSSLVGYLFIYTNEK